MIDMVDFLFKKHVQIDYIMLWDNVENYNAISTVPLTKEEFIMLKELAKKYGK